MRTGRRPGHPHDVSSAPQHGAGVDQRRVQISSRSTAAVRAARTFPQYPGQRGLATSAQVRDAGWSYSAIKHALSTSWQSPFPGVFAPHRGQLDLDTLLVAAALWAGEGAVLTGMLGLVRLGVTIDEPGDALFLVPERARGRRVCSDGRTVRALRTARPVIIAPSGQAPDQDVVLVASAARALADAAVYQPQQPGQGEHLAITVLQRGLCSTDDLRQELARRSRPLVTELARGLRAFENGAWSRPEATLRRVVGGEPGLPEMITNATLVTQDGAVVGRPDGYLPDVGVVIQVHSRAHHQGLDALGGSRWAATVEKDSAYAAAGLLVVAVAPWTLYSTPEVFVRRLRLAVEQGRRRTPPDLRIRAR